MGLKFWAHGEPLSQGGLLDDMAASLGMRPGEARIDRPTRKFGAMRHFAAADIYLSDFRPAYHALRPLRFVLDCTVEPVVDYLKELMHNVACQIIPCGTAKYRGTASGRAAQAHFGIQFGDDGENCRVVNERGQSVEIERLSALVAASLACPVMQGGELRQQTFLRIRESRLRPAPPTRPARLWYTTGHAPLPDALRTLTILLVLLTRDDLAFSAVLDREGRN